jgi:hypothetical protein
MYGTLLCTRSSYVFFHVSLLNRCNCEHINWKFEVLNEVSILLVY